MGNAREDNLTCDDIVVPPLVADPLLVEAVDEAVRAGDRVPRPTRATDDAGDAVYHSFGGDDDHGERYGDGTGPHDFDRLYERHRRSFALHARRFLRDARDVDDVVQEAFLRLHLALPSLHTELQAIAYCRRTVTNLCIDRYRQDLRRPTLVDLDEIPEPVEEEYAADPVVLAEAAVVVRRALAMLSPLHRDALLKREVEEKPLPVIAGELGIEEHNVKHVLLRARRALRRLLVGSPADPRAEPTPGDVVHLDARRPLPPTQRMLRTALTFLLVAASAGVGATDSVDNSASTQVGTWTAAGDGSSATTV